MKQLENVLHFTNINAITDTGQDHKCMSNVLGKMLLKNKIFLWSYKNHLTEEDSGRMVK